MERSDDFTLKVGGEDVFVHSARVSAVPLNWRWPGYQRPLEQTELASFAYWDTAGPAEAVVESKRPVETVAVRPASRGITPEVQRNRISFEMPGPGHLTVEVNGIRNALHLFASRPEDYGVNPDDPNVLYFGPGEHDPGVVKLKSGQTMYIASGAVVYGAVLMENVSDVRLVGRGILDGGRIRRYDAPSCVVPFMSENVEIGGIVIRDPNVYGIYPMYSRDVRIFGVKLIGFWRYNTDGIHFANCADSTVENCFLRTFDDSIIVKGQNRFRSYLAPVSEPGPCRNITVSNCVIWNDWGRALEIGAKTIAPEISNITYRDCDIIHCGHIALDIQNGDRALVRDFLYENIRFEIDPVTPRPIYQQEPHQVYADDSNGAYCPSFIVLQIKRNFYSEDEERGRIRNIRFRNIEVLGDRVPPSNFTGFDADHLVEDVTLENVRIGGKPVTDLQTGNITANEFVKNVRFSPSRELLSP
jgi:hypothetical protein